MYVDRKWTLGIGEREHLIEADYGAHIVDPDSPTQVLAHREGTLAVDGKTVQKWDSDLPREITVEIEGRSVVLRAGGFFTKGLELIFDGRKIKPSKV